MSVASSGPTGRRQRLALLSRLRGSPARRRSRVLLLLFPGRPRGGARRGGARGAHAAVRRAPVATWIPLPSRARVDAGETGGACASAFPPRSAVTFTDVVRGPITTDIAMIGDFVLLRQNGLPAYNFAVVVDDVAMPHFSLVVRGEDHVPNTPRQRRSTVPSARRRRSSRISRWCWARITRHCPSGTGRHRALPSSGPRHPSGSLAQLSRAARVVTRRRRGDPANRGTRAALPCGRRSPRARACSTPTSSRG